MTVFANANGSTRDFGAGWASTAHWTDDNWTKVVASPSNPTHSGYAIEKYWHIGDVTDEAPIGLTTLDNFPFPCDVLYQRLWLKFSSNWDLDPVYGGMKFGYWGLEGHDVSAPTEFWSSNNSAGAIPWKIHFASNIDGDLPVENTTANEVIYLNQWTKIEFLQTAQSARNVADGTLKIWVDGRLVMDLTGKNWQTNAALLTSTLFDGRQLFFIRGESGHLFRVNDSMQIGEVYISGKIAGPTASVTLSGGAIATTVGGAVVTRTAAALNAAGHTRNGRVFTAVSSNAAIATVAVVGDQVAITPVAEGACTVTVSCDGFSTAPRVITISAAPSILLIADGGAAGGATGATTVPAVNTTGAKLLVFASGYLAGQAIVVSDSKGNVITGLSVQDSGNVIAGREFYTANPVVGAGHDATVAGGSTFSSIVWAAFSGITTVLPLDGQSGAKADTVSLLATGAVVPSVANCLAVTCLALRADRVVVPPAGYTLVDGIGAVGGTNLGIYLAYKVCGAIAAENPQWSWSGGAGDTDATATLAIFKPA